MTTKAEMEQHRAWLEQIKTMELFDIAETLLEGYHQEAAGMLAEYGNPSDLDELAEEVAVYRARLAELKGQP